MEFSELKLGRVVFARLFENEDLLESVTQLAEKAQVSAGFFVLIGTLWKAKMGFFKDGEYEPIEMDQPLEIVSCVGDVSVREGKIFVHAHIAVSDEAGRVFGGHVMQGCVIGVTAELVLVEATGSRLMRVFDEKTKLHLLSLGRFAHEPSKKQSSI